MGKKALKMAVKFHLENEQTDYLQLRQVLCSLLEENPILILIVTGKTEFYTFLYAEKFYLVVEKNFIGRRIVLLFIKNIAFIPHFLLRHKFGCTGQRIKKYFWYVSLNPNDISAFYCSRDLHTLVNVSIHEGGSSNAQSKEEAFQYYQNILEILQKAPKVNKRISISRPYAE